MPTLLCWLQLPSAHPTPSRIIPAVQLNVCLVWVVCTARLFHSHGSIYLPLAPGPSRRTHRRKTTIPLAAQFVPVCGTPLYLVVSCLFLSDTEDQMAHRDSWTDVVVIGNADTLTFGHDVS